MRTQPESAEHLRGIISSALPGTKWAVANGDVSYVLKCACLLKVPDVGPVRVTLAYHQRNDELEYVVSRDSTAPTSNFIDDETVDYMGVKTSLEELIERTEARLSAVDATSGPRASDQHHRLTVSLMVLKHLLERHVGVVRAAAAQV